MSLSLVDHEVEFLCTDESVVLHLLDIFFFVRKNPSSCDCTGIRTYVPFRCYQLNHRGDRFSASVEMASNQVIGKMVLDGSGHFIPAGIFGLRTLSLY